MPWPGVHRRGRDGEGLLPRVPLAAVRGQGPRPQEGPRHARGPLRHNIENDEKAVMMASVNSVSQMTNSATWFDRAWRRRKPGNRLDGLPLLRHRRVQQRHHEVPRGRLGDAAREHLAGSAEGRRLGGRSRHRGRDAVRPARRPVLTRAAA